MTTTQPATHRRATADPMPGPLGRLGLWTVRHARLVALVWVVVVVGLGIFAPRVEHDLSGAGWQADGS